MAVAGLLTATAVQLLELLSDSEDEDEIETAVTAWTSITREDRIKCQDYFEFTTVNYLPDEYKRFFKVSVSTVEKLCKLLSSYPEFKLTAKPRGRTPVPLEKKVLMTLRYLASSDTIHDLSDRFNVTDFTLLRCKKQIINALNMHLLSKFIRWPKAQEMQEISTQFNEFGTYYFPNVVGAIDGCHIAIEAPQENPKSYYNRKGFHSIILQAVCSNELKFTDISVGWPGRVHDSKVLKNTSLWDSGFQKCLGGRFHILGDAAYPIKEWLLTPFRDNGHLTPQQQHFNTALSSKRQVIERSFAHLKGRFRRLKFLSARSMETVCKTITAACIMHNICIIENDELDNIFTHDTDDNDVNLPQAVVQQQDAQGQLKRLRIVNNL